jgi:hypothetical protein
MSLFAKTSNRVRDRWQARMRRAAIAALGASLAVLAPGAARAQAQGPATGTIPELASAQFA